MLGSDTSRMRVVFDADNERLIRGSHQAAGAVASASRSFQASARKAETASVRQGRAAQVSERHTRRLGSSLLAAGKYAAGAAAAYLSIAAARKAIATTTDLGKATMALHRNLGLSIRSASRWAAVAKARGVDTDTLSTSFTNLSKALEAALGGNKDKLKAFRDLGITQRDLVRGSKDYDFLLGKMADGLGKMEGGTHRAALAQQLLGRSAQTTLPIFTQGAKAMDEQLRLADKYHLTLDGKTIKSVKDLARAQRELEFAQMGLQMQFTRTFTPALLELASTGERLGKIFSNPDLTGEQKFRALGRILGPLSKEIQRTIEELVPQIADSMAKAAPHAVGAFFTAFRNSSLWAKLLLGGWLLKKTGALSAFGAMGRAGAERAAAGATSPTAWGRFKGRFGGIGKGVGITMGIMAVASFADAFANSPDLTNFSDRLRRAVSSITFGIVEDPSKEIDEDFRKTFVKLKKSSTETGQWIVTALQKGQRIGLGDGTILNTDRFDAGKRRVLIGLEKIRIESAKLDRMGISIDAKVNFDPDKLRDVRRAIDTMSHSVQSSIEGMRTNVRLNMRLIRRTFRDDSLGAKIALSKNFDAAAQAVRNMMAAGVISTKRGLAEIQRLMDEKLRLFGVDPGQYRKGAAGRGGGTGTGVQGGLPRQRGGLIPGFGDGDKVHVMAEPGEGFINKKAVRALGGPAAIDAINRAMPRFARGGMVDPAWDPGTERINRAISGIVGRWAKTYRADMTAGYDPGGSHVSPGHNVTGTATDMVPGAGGSWSLLERGLRALIRKNIKVLYGTDGIGIPWPNHGRGNHAHIEWGMAPPSVGALGKIGRVTVAGAGLMGSVAQGAVDNVRGAVNRKNANFAFARGGIVGASQFGGPNDPGTGHVGYKGDDLRGTMSWAELGKHGGSVGDAFGGLPYKTPIWVTYHGKTQRLIKRDIGRGGSDVKGRNRSVDIWWEAARKLGFNNLDTVRYSLGAPSGPHKPKKRKRRKVAKPGAAPGVEPMIQPFADYLDRLEYEEMAGILAGARAELAERYFAFGLDDPKQGLVSKLVKLGDYSDAKTWLQTARDLRKPGMLFGPEADTGSTDSALADLLREQNLDLKRGLALSQAQYGVFKDFLANLGPMPYLGGFAHGTARVARTGLAVLHRDEMVSPDPQGPFGRQASVPAGAGPPVEVKLVLAGDAGQLVQLVDARIAGKQAQIARSSDAALGRRSRQLQVAPGR